jgi:hypothetical protein
MTRQISRVLFFPNLSKRKHSDCPRRGFQLPAGVVYPFGRQQVRTGRRRLIVRVRKNIPAVRRIAQRFADAVDRLQRRRVNVAAVCNQTPLNSRMVKIHGFCVWPALASINRCTGATTMSSRSALGVLARSSNASCCALHGSGEASDLAR